MDLNGVSHARRRLARPIKGLRIMPTFHRWVAAGLFFLSAAPVSAYTVTIMATPASPQAVCPGACLNVSFKATISGDPESTSECTLVQGQVSWYYYAASYLAYTKNGNPVTFKICVPDTAVDVTRQVFAFPDFYYVPKNPSYTGCPTIDNSQGGELDYNLDVEEEPGDWSTGVNVSYAPPAAIQTAISTVFSHLAGGAVTVDVSANFQKQSKDCCDNGTVKPGGVTRDSGSLKATVDLANVPVVIDGVPLSVTKSFSINDTPLFEVTGNVKAGIYFTADTSLTGTGSYTSSTCPDVTPSDCFTGSVGLGDTLGISGTAQVTACVAVLGGQANCANVGVSAKAEASVTGSLSDSTCNNVGLSITADLTAADAGVSATLGGITDTVTIYHLGSPISLYP